MGFLKRWLLSKTPLAGGDIGPESSQDGCTRRRLECIKDVDAIGS